MTKSTEKKRAVRRWRRRRGRCGGGGGLSKSWASFSALSALPSSFPPRSAAVDVGVFENNSCRAFQALDINYLVIKFETRDEPG